VICGQTFCSSCFFGFLRGFVVSLCPWLACEGIFGCDHAFLKRLGDALTQRAPVASICD
jgi:hypothetical protein